MSYSFSLSMKSNNHLLLLQFCPSHSSTQDDLGNTKVACSSTCSTHLTLFWLTTVQTVPSIHFKKITCLNKHSGSKLYTPSLNAKIDTHHYCQYPSNKTSYFLASHKNLNICHLQTVWPIKMLVALLLLFV